MGKSNGIFKIYFVINLLGYYDDISIKNSIKFEWERRF